MVREVGAEVVAQGKVVVAEIVLLADVPTTLVAVKKYEYEELAVSPVSAYEVVVEAIAVEIVVVAPERIR